ncbi:iron ABC transporter permease [Microbacterium sp. Marseille-Q6965]|uniref:FecCD family ABC transporter permease n=1 Tax=Microbacterium sp. Marseille-Q6965 TaxID=2965072 RepID=UPI0021B8451D|nr:iron ABC transporter permease [Microbacterium sp. Marseille-Q6965]
MSVAAGRLVAAPLPRRRGLARRAALVVAVVVGVLLALLVATAIGPIPTPLGDVLAALGGSLRGEIPTGTDALVLTVRLPRVLVAALVGAALAVSGVVMQALFRNPLAEPGIIGVSSGAAVGAVTAIVAGAAATAWWMLPLAAFVGALAATLAVQAIAQLAGGAPSTLVLMGIAINALLGAVVAAVLANASEASDVQRVMFWLNGDLTARTWGDAAVAAGPVLVCVALLCVTGPVLNLFTLSEEQASATGVNVPFARHGLLAIAALATAAAVCVTGVISFVGLVVPHLVRLLAGADHRRLLPLSAAVGAVFLVLADVGARMLFDPIVLQTGTVTALIGAPALMLLVLRRRRVAA